MEKVAAEPLREGLSSEEAYLCGPSYRRISSSHRRMPRARGWSFSRPVSQVPGGLPVCSFVMLSSSCVSPRAFPVCPAV
eukprot:9488803-Pyramimonas_sp.AAC.1